MTRASILALAAAAFAAPLTAVADDNPTASATFARDIAPILQAHCQTCHRPGEAAPMSLLTYQDARPWAKSIREQVSSRAMPPWHADPAVGKWRNDPSLTDAEIDKVVKWANGGAPEGNPADAPPPHEWSEGWLIGKPDMIFTMPVEQKLPADLVDQYRYIAIPTKLQEDTWIEAIEVRPGNREVVHHVNAFETTSLASVDMKALTAALPDNRKDKEGKAKKMSGQGSGPQGEPPGRVGGFLPGGLPIVMAEGEAILLPKGCSLLLQVHYHKESGVAATDRSSVGVRVCKNPPKVRARGGAVDNCWFTIPAGAADHQVDAETVLDDDIKITGMSPHMHLRGKDYKVWAELPGGERRDLLNVPRYDFNWQTTYEPAEPIALPKGTKLRTQAHYDNSKGNKFNPNPEIDVEWGEPTTDEMMLMFFRYTRDRDPLGS